MILLATARRWAPALFLVLAASGQAVLYWAASRVVERPRPSFGDLATANLPAQASFPSVHVAAWVGEGDGGEVVAVDSSGLVAAKP